LNQDIPLWVLIVFPILIVLSISFALFCCCKKKTGANKIDIKDAVNTEDMSLVTQQKSSINYDSNTTNKPLRPNGRVIMKPIASPNNARILGAKNKNAKNNESLTSVLNNLPDSTMTSITPTPPLDDTQNLGRYSAKQSGFTEE
jgi:hypothetical protein